MTRRVEEEAVSEICGPVRFISFEKTDTGFLAKVSFRVVEGVQGVTEKYIHSELLEDLTLKLSRAIMKNGVE